jgi:hypothetical protein
MVHSTEGDSDKYAWHIMLAVLTGICYLVNPNLGLPQCPASGGPDPTSQRNLKGFIIIPQPDGFAILHCLQEQHQQLQALHAVLHYRLALDSSSWQDGWADPLLLPLPVGLRCLQLTVSWLTVQKQAIAALSRLQQRTQLTIS